jgi:hypothetical protein
MKNLNAVTKRVVGGNSYRTASDLFDISNKDT